MEWDGQNDLPKHMVNLTIHPNSFYFLDGQNGLKIVWKMIRKMSKIVWFCEFWDDINGWDLKILYRDLESWKKGLKKNKMK